MKIHKPISFNFRSLFFLFFSFWIVVSALLGSFLFIFSHPVSATIINPISIATFTGEAVSNSFGYSSSSAGDVNNDGYDDVIVGAHKHNAGLGTNQGSAYIFYGGLTMDSNPDVIMNGLASINDFGCSVSSAGDVNNDGYDDVIVGARYRNAGLGASQGSAYIFYGGSAMDSSADVTMNGEAAANWFGSSVSSVGDVNNDGYDDVIVGATLHNAGLGAYQGTAYIFHGGSAMDSSADVIINGEAAGDWFGSSVSSAGDVNNDGYDDVIVSARNHNAGLGASQGSAYIFYGGSVMDSSADVTINGEAAGDWFGCPVSSAGDVNNDGFDDVIAAAPLHNAGLGANQGTAYIFHGGFTMDSNPDVIMNGLASGDYFGYSVSSAGDVSNDGYDDVVVSAPYRNAGLGTNQGTTYIFYGGSSIDINPDVSINGYAAGDWFGSSISLAKDTNNDGWKEFLTAASDYSSNTGRAYLYNLNYASPTISVTDNNYVNFFPVNITGTAIETGVNVQGVQISLDSGDWISCFASDGVFDSASESYTCLLSGLAEGSHSVRVRSYDVNNVYIPSTLYATDDFIVDTTFPTGSISINSNETITNTDEVTLTLSATDNLSGVSKMMVSNKVDYSGGTWETYNTSKEWRLSTGDGEKRVYVKYRDEVGNISSSYSDSIEMDMGAPTGTLVINEGEEYTSSREVVLHITGEDEVTGVEEMRISEDRTMEGVEWEGYETSREYTLSEGDGYKVIYIQYRDGIGNESEVYGSNITLDSNTEIDITEIGEEEVEGEIENWETEETTPTFTGEGEVGATITIEIEGIETGTVIVNEDGVWSWTPSIELTRGQEYNVIITSRDLAGNEDIQSFTLGIVDEEVIEVNQTTPEAQTTTTQLPNTGVIFIIGLMVMGGLLWTGVNLKMIEKLKKR